MESTGTIVFHIFTSNAKIPVEGATILVRQQESPNRLMGIRVTDESGQTDSVVIPTRQKSFSQTPEQVVQPWAGLNIVVEHPDYERVLLEGIQVFPDVNTVQNVQLVPLNEFDPELDGQREFLFTPQPIWEGRSYD